MLIFLIFFGKRKGLIGHYEAFMYECPYCTKINTTTLYIYSRYYHIFRVPLFPFEKEGRALCNECKANRNENQFGPKLVAEFKENRSRFRHPWWTRTWIWLVLALFITAMVIGTINKKPG